MNILAKRMGSYCIVNIFFQENGANADALYHPAFIRLFGKKLIIVTAHWNGSCMAYGPSLKTMAKPSLLLRSGCLAKHSKSRILASCVPSLKKIGTDDWWCWKSFRIFKFYPIPGVFQGVVPTKPPLVATELGTFNDGKLHKSPMWLKERPEEKRPQWWQLVLASKQGLLEVKTNEVKSCLPDL